MSSNDTDSSNCAGQYQQHRQVLVFNNALFCDVNVYRHALMKRSWVTRLFCVNTMVFGNTCADEKSCLGAWSN